VEPDGRGVPAPHLVSGERRCRTGLAGHLCRSTQEPGLLMLFRAGPQGYPPRGSPLNGAQSGKCRPRRSHALLCCVTLLDNSTLRGASFWQERARRARGCSRSFWPSCVIVQPRQLTAPMCCAGASPWAGRASPYSQSTRAGHCGPDDVKEHLATGVFRPALTA
jgi:hypothetical protein